MIEYSLELLPIAEEELNDSFEWYEKQRNELGHQFINEVSHYLSIIERNPLHYPLRYGKDLRFAPLSRFPFLIVYWIEESRGLIVVASFFHTSRRPKKIKNIRKNQ